MGHHLSEHDHHLAEEVVGHHLSEHDHHLAEGAVDRHLSEHDHHLAEEAVDRHRLPNKRGPRNLELRMSQHSPSRYSGAP